MNELSKHFCNTAQTLSEGMLPGAYNKLRDTFPEYFKEINEKLDNDFTIEGIDEYRETYIRGFKKVGMWRES